jgi:pseudouridine-5'-phosphate glycosidase
MELPDTLFTVAPEVAEALAHGRPVVALETAILTHGLPRTVNVETALAVEEEVRRQGAVPATIGIVAGRIVIGLCREEICALGEQAGVRKCSLRDLPVAVAQGAWGGTTVAATAWAAARAGIEVFVTGGIGGVHRQAATTFDISADLPALAGTPVTVVCAGAKSVLDLAATREYLETIGVPVLGFQTDEFPAFYVRTSGLPVDARVDSPVEAARIIATARALGQRHGLLVCVPPPAEQALDAALVERLLDEALAAAREAGVRGKEVTPFLLASLERASGGATLIVNVALIRQNARVGAAIAAALAACRSKAPPCSHQGSG